MKFSSGIIYESTIEFGVEKYLTQRVKCRDLSLAIMVIKFAYEKKGGLNL